MAERKTHKLGIVDATRDLFRRQGYAKTSMAEIAAACGLLKGSIYHYFPGKQELGVAVLERELELTRTQVFNYAREAQDGAETALQTTVLAPVQTPVQTPVQAPVQAYCTAVESYFLDPPAGCLMANLVHEFGDTLPAMTGPLRRYFQEWIEAVAHLLTPRQGPHRARELAADIVARTQGALLLVRLDGQAAVILSRVHHDLKANV